MGTGPGNPKQFEDLHIFLAFLLNQPYNWCLLIQTVVKDDVLLAELSYRRGSVMILVIRIGLFLQN